MEVMSKAQTATSITWDFGTAYELFVSLHVLHEPGYFGIRPSFAAGIRARIPAAERKLLEDFFPISGVPLRWLATLPAPKDAISALWALKQIPPAERLLKLYMFDEDHGYDNPEERKNYETFKEIILRVSSTGTWTPEDIDYFYKTWHKKHGGLKKDAIERFLDWCSRPEELGEGYLSAINSYYQAFFEEEEKRISPALKIGLENAQALASRVSFDELFSELSQGIKLDEEFNAKSFVIAPAFWTTPLIFFEKLDKDTMLLLFGARPADMSVIPGESVPDALVRSLKALADPTRLKILFYLSKENLTPSEIARRLQLRPPTVTHHLRELRLASLVELSMANEENRYTIRKQALELVFGNLKSFLEKDPE
jgi:DNA-binding transcriptional ArsR family regulator